MRHVDSGLIQTLICTNFYAAEAKSKDFKANCRMLQRLIDATLCTKHE